MDGGAKCKFCFWGAGVIAAPVELKLSTKGELAIRLDLSPEGDAGKSPIDASPILSSWALCVFIRLCCQMNFIKSVGYENDVPYF